MENDKNKLNKTLKYIGVTITLGAIGSGLWDRFLSKFSDYIIAKIAKLFGKISTGYIDYLYSNVGDNMKEVFSYHIYAFLMFFLILIHIFGSVKIFNLLSKIIAIKKDRLLKPETNNEEQEKLSKQKEREAKLSDLEKRFVVKQPKVSQYLTIILTVLSLSFLLSVIVKHIYSYNTSLYIEKSIDIISPYVENKERLILISEYRLIDNYENFAKLNNRLVMIAKKENINLPEFTIVLK